MKVLILSTWDREGGAARAAYSTHKSLQQAGIDSRMLVANKSSEDSKVIGLQPLKYSDAILRETRLFFNSIELKLYKNKSADIFSVPKFADKVLPEIRKINPDIINLHWICKGFLTPEILAKFNKPIVWTLQDMWSFTGGCHYASDCLRYLDSCGSCPQLASHQEQDISRKLWRRKQQSWQNLNLTVVAVSHWLADCARRSSLFKERRIEVIPNVIDASTFKPRAKNVAREILNLPLNHKIILFGAIRATQDKRKGFEYLVPAVQKIAQTELGKNTEVVVFGAAKPQNAPDLGMKTTYLGTIKDDIMLSLVYAAADVMLVPSTEDACPQTPIESLACGTPVVCFDASGLKDIVEHRQNGYRAQCFSSDDLAAGITWVLQDEERWHLLSQRAQEKVEQEFTGEILAQAYLNLYQEILSSR
ncbi:MAG: glycosyltransferase [Symploca sp. SIO3E6]|nr:glycosyltransferase [Caldora sp. SIO3E6]